jgi:hypothetical protein
MRSKLTLHVAPSQFPRVPTNARDRLLVSATLSLPQTSTSHRILNDRVDPGLSLDHGQPLLGGRQEREATRSASDQAFGD